MTKIAPRDLPDSSASPPAETGIDLTALSIDITQIQPYERNPRQGRNPEYDRIKDSIRSHGLDQTLVVTKRPGAADYIVHAGGNTRLLILKELYEETSDPRLSRIPCLFRPWNCESDVLLAHLRENDLRGSLTFIDKARAVFEAKQFIEEESGVGEMTDKDLVIKLRSSGYSIGATLVCQMAYAVRTLLPLIPKALEAGMGGRHVVRIRALERAGSTLWQRCCSGGDGAFDEVFAALCRRYDAPEWDTDVLKSAIETEIAEAAETSIHTIRVALDAEMNARELIIPEFVPIKEAPKPETRDRSDGNRVIPAVAGGDDSEAGDSGVNRTSNTLPDSVAAPSEPPVDPVEPGAGVFESLCKVNDAKPNDLKSLRARAWTLAARLAQRHGIGELVIPLSGKGLGFALRDVPDPVLADQLDEDALAQVCTLWWQLAACAEMTYAPLESILPLLPADSVLRRALEEEDAELLFSSIWTLDPGHTGYRLWRPLPDRDWQDLLALMDTYRRIRHLAAETGVAIWD
jgi:ParB family protein of integrating conjugative element (PFGI_1 class)